METVKTVAFLLLHQAASGEAVLQTRSYLDSAVCLCKTSYRTGSFDYHKYAT